MRFTQPARSACRLPIMIGILVIAVAGTCLAQSKCQLKSPSGKIKHVIYVQFDNTHFLRDNPNVPSDLEQMPHLLNFIKDNGVLMSNDHTVLISHTGTGILTSLTGVYPDRMGQPVSNSFRYFKTDGTTRTGVTFAYPWVPFTRAGCDFGAVATANTILENIAIDIPTVFGAGSPEASEADASNAAAAGTAARALAQTDFVGIGVHCAKGSSLCSAANHGRPDLQPDEPGGYNGFSGLFGAKYVDPVINTSGPMRDLDGNVIQDPFGQPGFPGFDGMEATVSLAWIAQMQEADIPITYAYIPMRMTHTALPATFTSRMVPEKQATRSNCRTTIAPSRSSLTGSPPTELTSATRCSSLRLTKAIIS